jgi:hypothetical protein
MSLLDVDQSFGLIMAKIREDLDENGALFALLVQTLRKLGAKNETKASLFSNNSLSAADLKEKAGVRQAVNSFPYNYIIKTINDVQGRSLLNKHLYISLIFRSRLQYHDPRSRSKRASSSCESSSCQPRSKSRDSCPSERRPRK